MQLLFGDRAYQIAGMEANWRSRRAWLRRALKLMMREVTSLDTTPRHREMLIAELDAISTLITTSKDASWELVYRFFRVCSRFLGFDYSNGAKCHSVAYWQDAGQRFTSELLAGKANPSDDDPQSILALRRAIVAELDVKGIDSFGIGLILNCSEHQVKQIRKSARIGGARRRKRR